MRIPILAFAAGIGWLQFQPQLPDPRVIGFLLLAGLLLISCARRLQRGPLRLSLLAVAALVLGVAWAALLAQARLQHSLPAQWEGRDIAITGTIASLPDRFAQGSRFDFLVEQALSPEDGAAVPVPPRIALSWYAGRDDVPLSNAVVEPGERWQMTVRLRRPHGNANPHGFDYEAWLLERGVRATGYVRAAPAPQRLSRFVPGFSHAVERSRSRLRARILAALPDAPYAGVIVALVVGDQRAISQSDWRVFNRSGVGHLVSISGLHITMIAGLAAALMSALWRRSFFTGAALPLRLPAQKAAALAGALSALIYVLLAGFGVPAQRTLAMVVVVAIAMWSGRLTSVSHVLCAALGVVLVFDPWALLWPGFWLSFGAVAVMLFASVGRLRPAFPAAGSVAARAIASLKTAAYLQYVITIGLVPLSLLLFGQISLVSPMANAIAIPLVSFVITPLALAGSVLPMAVAHWVLGAAHQMIAWLAAGLTWLCDFPAAVWQAPAPSWWILGCALAGIAWLLAPRGWPYRWLGALALLPLMVNVPTAPGPGQMWVTAFDVGQGTALLVETEKHRLLYDTGPAYSPEADGASRVLLPYLRARGIDTLDGLIISHSDSDHAGGALSLLKETTVGWTATSMASGSAVVAAAPAHRACVAGQSWNWDGVQFDMLHPRADSYADAALKPNARSCTVKITLGRHVILLAGDIEAAQEADLLRQAPAALRATVLLAPHHGSGTSSSEPFLRQVAPELALFQVGYRNRYRHPKPEVYARYERLRIRRLRTDESGAITLRFEGAMQVSEFRSEAPRYWHPPPEP